MQSTPTKPTSANDRVERSNNLIDVIAQKAVLSLLEQMVRGSLRLTTREGGDFVFGATRARGKTDPLRSAGLRSEQPHIEVLNNRFFRRCLLYADLGLAESYLDGDCELKSIRQVISWFLLNAGDSPVMNESAKMARWLNSLSFMNKLVHWARRNSESMSRKNISDHYDLGNDFFKLILDPSMTYSSALFTDSDLSLEAAQQAKFERVASQLRLKPGQSLLEIGCGWGAFSIFAARQYGAKVTAITISREQYDYVDELLVRENLKEAVDLKLIDYRRVTGQFDKIVSIEMIEAVGDQYMDRFIAKIDSLLKPEGLLVMQMITSPDSRYETLKKNVDFIQKHIFPGSLLPSLYRVSTAMRRSGELFPIDLYDMTDSYVTTLAMWQERFNKNWSQLSARGFDERFRRKWNYYFEYCQAAFHMRNISVVQATYSRPNNFALSRECRS